VLGAGCRVLVRVQGAGCRRVKGAQFLSSPVIFNIINIVIDFSTEYLIFFC
jgi:hypothetical protein